MGRNRLKEIEYGHATIKDLAYWINERHSIFVNRFEKNLPKPWTDDKIFLKYKFTNAFRQLDKGTLALRNMLMRNQKDKKFDATRKNGFAIDQDSDPALIFFNVVWYRLFNWYEHAENLDFVTDFNVLKDYIEKCFRTHKKIFTGAHMTTGVAYEDKHISYLRACKIAWDKRHYFSQIILGQKRMEDAFKLVLELYMVGRFVAYELVCDLRFTSLLDHATDKLTWANMGPGAQRGLRRLGLPHKNQVEGLESMIELYKRLDKEDYLKYQISEHLPSHNIYMLQPPFELREVEHSLCEMDKYQRVKRGEGRPRSKYNGMA